MKRLMISFAAVTIIALAGLGVFAQEKDLKENIKLRETTWVNETSLEPGDYVVKYDAKAGEITIWDGKKVIATAKATVKMNEKSNPSDGFTTTSTATGRKLTGIRLGGKHEEITITDLSVETGKETPTSN